jgi:hypothetical protein
VKGGGRCVCCVLCVVCGMLCAVHNSMCALCCVLCTEDARFGCVYGCITPALCGVAWVGLWWGGLLYLSATALFQ